MNDAGKLFPGLFFMPRVGFCVGFYHFECLKKAGKRSKKNPSSPYQSRLSGFGADTQIRTGDLILTNYLPLVFSSCGLSFLNDMKALCINTSSNLFIVSYRFLFSLYGVGFLVSVWVLCGFFIIDTERRLEESNSIVYCQYIDTLYYSNVLKKEKKRKKEFSGFQHNMFPWRWAAMRGCVKKRRCLLKTGGFMTFTLAGVYIEYKPFRQ